MGRATKSKPAAGASATAANVADVPVVGGREPCPCGSGRRYKACHGRDAARSVADLVRRPFAGLPSECDWVALKDIVTAATARVTLRDEPEREIRVASMLPMALAALVRQDGLIWLGMQTRTASGDASRDAAFALARAVEHGPGAMIAGIAAGGGAEAGTARLQDVLDLSQPFEVAVHEGFDYWLDDAQDPDPAVVASLEQANEAVEPTARLASVEAAYWVRSGERTHVRWVMPYDEDPLLDALARLHAAQEDTLGPGSRLLGTFRAHGLLVPVWDLPPDAEADDVEEPAAGFLARLEQALAVTDPLTVAERKARAGLANRQLTIR